MFIYETKKENIMDKLKKIGVTALAGTLASFSAHAADVSFGGTSKVSYGTTTSDRGSGEDARRDAFNSDNTISASLSGELDNGFTVSGFMDDISNGQTSAAITIGMGSMGSVQINTAATGVVDAYDDILPVAYEEINDGAQHSVRGMDAGSDVEAGSISYISPSIEFGGATMSVRADFDPAAGAAAADGVGVAGAASTGKGIAYGGEINYGGLKVVGGYTEVQTKLDNRTTNSPNDKQSVLATAVYSMGPISIGYGEWYTNEKDAAVDYSTDGMSIAFAVNDELSLSWGELEDTREASSATAAATTEITAFQMAYTMGSMGIKLKHTDTDNGYQGTDTSAENTEIAISFSF